MKHIISIGLMLIVPVVQGCSDEKSKTRILVNVTYASPNDKVGVFVWTEPASNNPTLVYFGAGRGEPSETYENTLENIEAFGSADYAKSIIKYGWSPVRVFTVCAVQSKILPIQNPEDFSAVIISTNFRLSLDCTSEEFSSYPPDI